jgi:hypothetical protein
MAEALVATVKAGMKVWFCLQGEMNLSVMTYPGEYIQLYHHIKQILAQSPAHGQFEVSVGVCMNFNKLAGMNSIEKPSDLKKFGFDGKRVVQLLNTVDHIGISNYPEVRGAAGELLGSSGGRRRTQSGPSARSPRRRAWRRRSSAPTLATPTTTCSWSRPWCSWTASCTYWASACTSSPRSGSSSCASTALAAAPARTAWCPPGPARTSATTRTLGSSAPTRGECLRRGRDGIGVAAEVCQRRVRRERTGPGSRGWAPNPGQTPHLPSPPRRLLDPWQTWQPEAVEVPARTFLRQVYLMTSTYLKAGGLNYRVDGLFLWGCASWDQLGEQAGRLPCSRPAAGRQRADCCRRSSHRLAAPRHRAPERAPPAAAGVHPGSYSEQGSYRERGIVSIVSTHNANVNGVPVVSAAAKVLKNGTWVPGQDDVAP